MILKSIAPALICALVLIVVPLAEALKFDLQAHPGGESKSKERCVRNFAGKDTLVIVTVKTSGEKGDGQVLNLHIRDSVGNEYQKPKDIVGENRYTFKTHEDAAFDICFENMLNARHQVVSPQRQIELDVDIGADAKDWSGIQAAEKLKPVEVDLRRLEEVTQEIVYEMEYLRQREMKLRDTNESTNQRVKFFAIGTMLTLVALGVWQIIYLRAYFRSKHLI